MIVWMFCFLFVVGVRWWCVVVRWWIVRDMADTTKKSLLYSTCLAVLGFVCFVVGATAVGLPIWGYFDTPNGELWVAASCSYYVESWKEKMREIRWLVGWLGKFRQVGGWRPWSKWLAAASKQAFLQRRAFFLCSFFGNVMQVYSTTT